MARDKQLLEDPLTEIKTFHWLGPHPHIIRLVDHLVGHRQHLTVMEYCKDGDLMDFVLKLGRLSQSLCQQLVIGMLKTLQWIHNHGVAHLDVSLENFLVVKDVAVGRITLKLTDFGMAQFHPLVLLETDRSSWPRDLQPMEWKIRGRPGKLLYMSPEVYLIGKSVEKDEVSVIKTDARAADLWAIGVCLYQMLIGLPPWKRPCWEDKWFEWIMRGDMELLLRHWKKKISKDALNFLGCIFKPLESRATIPELLKHPFLCPLEKSSIPITPLAAAPHTPSVS